MLRFRRSALPVLPALFAITFTLLARADARAAIAFVQVKSATPQTAQVSVAVAFSAAQNAGSLNVVAVGWNDTTAHVQSVSDSKGNLYVLALGPTVRSGLGTQAIYYAKNVQAAAAGANSITVTFDRAAQFADIRIAEYSGIDPVNPLDVAVAGQGSSTTSSSGSVTTTYANDLLVGANLVSTRTSAPGSSYTSRIITSPDADILEDRVVTATGSYSATATLSPSGGWIMQMVAFRAANGAADTQAPTAPTALVASPASTTQINLAWTASTDNVAVTSYLIERCQGVGCATFAQIGTSAGTTFSSTGLTASTSYSYRIRATDAAGNLSAYSNTSTAVTPAPPDTQAPTAPGSLTATAASSSQIDLGWTASTDNVAVTNYLIERCQGSSCSNFAQVGTSTTTSFSSTGLAASTTYRHRVRATDAAGNLSAYSNIAAATTPATQDTQAPTAPSALIPSVVSSSQINLGWTGSTDDVAVTNYLIERCPGSACANFSQIGTATGTVFNNTGLSAGTTYNYRVRATDAAGNLSGYSNVAGATTSAPAPTIATLNPASGPIGTVVTIAGANFGSVQGSSVLTFNGVAAAPSTWSDTSIVTSVPNSASTGNVVVTVNAVASNGVNFTVGSAPTTIALVQHTGKDAGTTSSSSLAFASPNAAGNWLAVAIRAGQTGQTIAVSDTRGNVYRKAVQLNETADGTTLALFYAENITAGANTVTVSDSLSGGTLRFSILEYSGVAASSSLDVAAASQGNGSAVTSGPATTTAGGDLVIGLISTANPAAFTGGAGFTIQERVPASPNTKLAVEDRILPAAGSMSATATLGTSDSWGALVAAFKAAATGPDTTAPSVPAGLATTVVSSSQINLSWSPSTDNVAVTGYLIEQCQGVACSTFAQVGSVTGTAFSSLGLAGSTNYSFRVRATDAAANLSAYSNTASAMTPAPPDTQPPTAPAGLTATTISASRIDLTWTPSSDDVGVTSYQVERCQGVGCVTFASAGTSAGTSFSNTGLAGSTTYVYRVRALDAAANASPYSDTATATTQPAADTQPPTPPSGLSASAPSTTQIDLSWSASSDDVGVSAYLIEQCSGVACGSFSQVASVGGTTLSRTGLSASTSYSFRVRATDAAGNLSAYSNTATATTPAPPDTNPPTAPANLTATAISSSQINLTWTAATDDVAVTSYAIEECSGSGCGSFAQVGTSTGTTFSRSGLTASTSYSYRVRAADAAGNVGPYSATSSTVTQSPVPIAFVQTNNAVPQSSPTTVSVAYTAAQSAGDLNVVVVGWNSASGTVLTVTDTVGNTYVRAVGPTVLSGFGTQSIYYAASIGAAAASGNTVRVTFSAATSNPDVRIAEYRGLALTNPVDVVAAATGSGTSSDSGTATTTNANDLIVGANLVSSFTTGPGASFSSRVITTPDGDILEDRVVSSVGAYGATAPLSSGSWIMQMVAFKAASAPDTQPPSGPSNLAASSGGASFTDSNLTPATSYSYRVRATDAAGNLSVYSNTATVVTQGPDTEPPSAPGTLTAAAFSGTRIDLSWGPATDNVGVTGYRVEQCSGVGCTTFVKLATVTGTTFSDTALTPNTSYSYVVRAQDAAALLGPYSNAASTTTLTNVPELVAAYSFDEGTGPTTTDLSGNGNNGAVQNATWSSAGKYGSALRFNGSSALVTVPDAPSLRLTTGMTLEAWVNPTATPGTWADLVYKGSDNYFLEATSTSAGRPAAGATVGGVNTSAFGSATLPLNTWTHLAATYDGSTMRLYVNGSQAASVGRTGSIATSANPLQIGGDSLFGQFFAGLIDEVRIYNVALTPSQIQSDMGQPVGATVPVISLSPSSLDFGTQLTGTTGSPQPVTVTNIGGATMSIGSIVVGGLNAGDFAAPTTCGTVLAPNDSCSINVTFTPGAAGPRIGKITIADNAPGAPHAVNLSGTGAGFSIAPRVAVVTPGMTQQFGASLGTSGATWSVDGVEGGGTSSGTITSGGLYTAAAGAAIGTHTVSVTTSDGLQTSTATVYVTAHPGVFTHHNDNARTGQNVSEVVLTPDTVSSASFGKVASYVLDGNSHASPLYVAGVPIAGIGTRNVVYVATEHDSVYAFDADALSSSPLWQVSFINPAAGVTTVPSSETGECCDIAPEIGITGTPVIDQATQTLYVVAKTKEVTGGNTVYRQRLHALDLASGAEKFGGPVLIQASVPGSGGGAQGGSVPFDALHENQRPALLLSNGVVYIGFGSHGDIQPYHGWLLGYAAGTLQQVFAHNSSPNGDAAGMWQANGGPAADAAGNIYFITGNGEFNVNTGGTEYGDSFVKISPSGTVLDYFTPHDQANISTNNFDLGAAGPMLLPDQPGAHPRLLISAGKNNTVYLLDRDSLGHYNATNDNQIVQSLVNIFPFGRPEPGNYSAPVYFNGTVYFGPIADTIQAFKLTNGLLSTTPTSASSVAYPYPGASMSISANGSSNGILWAIQRNGDCGTQVTCGSAAPGVLRAYDASNLGVQLYSSDQAGSRDTLDFAAKFSVPLVVNGKVFVTTIGRLTIYGLLP